MNGTSYERPVLFAYDGLEGAKAAIRQAASQLQDGRRALVLTVLVITEQSRGAH